MPKEQKAEKKEKKEKKDKKEQEDAPVDKKVHKSKDNGKEELVVGK
jgi:hypothetical protein